MAKSSFERAKMLPQIKYLIYNEMLWMENGNERTGIAQKRI